MAIVKEDPKKEEPVVRRADATRRRYQPDDELDHASPMSISAIRGGCLHSAAMKIVLGLLIVIFALGFAFSGLNGGGLPQGGGAGRDLGPDPVASVAGQEIKRDELGRSFSQQVQMYEQFGQAQAGAQLLQTRQQTLDQLVGRSLTLQAAKTANLGATDAEIDAKIKEYINDRIKGEQGQNANPLAFRRQIEELHGSMQQYRDELSKDYDRDAVRDQLLIDKLEKKIKDENKVTEADYKKSVTKLKLRQIIVRAKPAAPGTKDVKAAGEKAAQDAKARAERIAGAAKKAPTAAAFAALAKKESDDQVTKAKGGDLGLLLPTQLPLPPKVSESLKDAKPGVVGPVQEELSKDYYIFLVENTKLDLPKDFAKNKKKLIADFETQKDNERWTAYQEELKKGAEPELYDPALKAFHIQSQQVPKAMGEEANTLRRQALELYEQSLASQPPIMATAIRLQMAQLLRETGQTARVTEVLQEAVKETPDDSNARLELARALREGGKAPDAQKQLQQLSKQLDTKPAAPSAFGGNPNDAVRMQIAGEYDQLGKKTEAAAERKKIVPPKGQPGMPGGFNMNGGNIQVQPGR